MADEIVSSDLKIFSGTSVRPLELAETIASGEAVRVSNQKLYKAQAVAAEEDTEAAGICLVGGDAGEYGVYVSSGELNPGFAVTVGVAYYVSTTSGGITKAIADISGAGVTVLGIGKTTSKLSVDVKKMSSLAA